MLWQELVMFSGRFGDAPFIRRICLGRVFGVCWLCGGHVSGMCWAYFGCMLAMRWAFVGLVLGMNLR